jgi:sigma-54 specific flagellar transcriptional regulator A
MALHARNREDVVAGRGSAFVGSSAAVRNVRQMVRRVAAANASVLITGPSGSGKEVVARLLHESSPRAARAFVPLNCGAVPRDLFESELFGHEKGSFTGAINRREGRFEAADGGTIFLDEIGDMPADMQVKLLRVLEDRTIQRVGANDCLAVDVRVISATHRPMETLIADGRFREDLFYRLGIFPIHLPALAERREDIPELVEHFSTLIGGSREAIAFETEALQMLCEYAWPGNVRELRNFMERAAILHGDRRIDAGQARFLLRLGKANAMLPAESAARPSGGNVVVLHPQADAAPASSGPETPPMPVAETAPNAADLLARGGINLKDMLAEMEIAFIRAALSRSDHVIADAARLLGLQRTTLCEKMRKYGMAR